MYKKICQECNAEFFARNKMKKYCCQECSSKAAYKRLKKLKPKEKKICDICGETFETRHGNQRRCDKCYMAMQLKSEDKPKKICDHLDKVNKEARAEGITYGQYQAKKLLQYSRVDLGEIK